MNFFVFSALCATTFTWALTALGAASVIFFKKINTDILNFVLGFSAGVMISASFWSLLQPAVYRAKLFSTMPAYLVVTLGFISGAAFIRVLDILVSKAILKANSTNTSSGKSNRIMMLILSITLHNIPEGLAVGVAFGTLKENYSITAFTSAISIAIGIGLQNLPEGAAVSLPLRKEGYSRKKSFFYGQLSAIVEPIFGVIGAILVMTTEKILPFALSFASGAMILVAVHELIPECQKNQKKETYIGTTGIIFGFAVMMLLDIAFG